MPSDKRTRLLDAALMRFTLRGLHGTTTADISREAGVAAGTFFTYFLTKEAIVEAAYLHAELALWEGVGWRADYPRDTVYDALRRVWAAMGARALAHPRAFRFWALCWATPGVPLRRMDDDGPRRRLRPFRGTEQLLALVLGRPAAEGQELACGLEGHWQAAVECALAFRSDAAPDAPATPALARAFDAWWAGVGLDRTVPFPVPAPAPVPAED
jgi:AcrR family transcriptional regulator